MANRGYSRLVDNRYRRLADSGWSLPSLTNNCDWRVNVLKLAYQAYVSKRIHVFNS